MKRYAVVGAAAIFAIGVYIPAVAGGRDITICHVPPGNPDNAQTLTLPAPAARAHLREHPLDYRGPCSAATSSTSAPSTTNATTSTSTSTTTTSPTTTAATTPPAGSTTSNPTTNAFLSLSARCGPSGAFFLLVVSYPPPARRLDFYDPRNPTVLLPGSGQQYPAGTYNLFFPGVTALVVTRHDAPQDAVRHRAQAGCTIPTTTTTVPPTTPPPSVPPTLPETFKFAGATTVCRAEVPTIVINFATPGFPSLAGRTGTLTMSDVNGNVVSTQQIVYQPGGHVELLYPGTSVNPDGSIADVPGWKLTNAGLWIRDPTDAFLRDGIHLTYEVNPTAEADITYPPESSICANPKNAPPPPPTGPPLIPPAL